MSGDTSLFAACHRGHNTKTIYDSLNRPLSKIDALGLETCYEYDKLNRPLKTIHPDATPNNWTDNPTTQTGYDKLGRRISSTDAGGKVTKYQYDSLSKLTAVTQSLNNFPLTTKYIYDEAGRLVGHRMLIINLPNLNTIKRDKVQPLNCL